MKLSSVLIAIIVLGCSAAPDQTPSSRSGDSVQPRTGMTTSSLVSALRTAGFVLTDAGVVEQPFFTVPAHVYLVDGEDVQIYEFATAADAERASRDVSPNGTTIGRTNMSWLAPPHFFRGGPLIVNYLGSSEKTLTELERLLGPQFAGQ